jgi:ABC-type sugar transport system ATPase subunit
LLVIQGELSPGGMIAANVLMTRALAPIDLMVSSYRPELLGVCDRIAAVRRGQVGEATPVAQTNSEKLMRAATGV